MPTTQSSATFNESQASAPAIITSGGSVGRPSRYEAPYRWNGTRGQQDRILAWLRESINEGEQFLKPQSGYKFVDASHRIIADIGFDELPETLSKTSLNFINLGTREMVGTLSNPRPIAMYKSENPDFDPQANILNMGYQHYYSASFGDRMLRKALQFAAIEGTGYLLSEWDPNFWRPGKGDARWTPLGVDAVLPIQIDPETWDIQSAYTVIIRRQFPITYLMKRFPQVAHLLVPDGENISRWRRLLNNLMDRVTPTVHNTYGSQRGYRGDDPAGRWLVTVYDAYILDYTLNTSGAPMPMGVINSPWSYTVPPYGGDVPTGMYDPSANMAPIYRKADAHDARIFPFRRHLIATRNVILQDDTSKYWHGEVPLVKFTLEDNPFEYCGIPITKQPAKLQASLTSLLRAYDDSSNAKLRPGLMYDESRVDTELARSFDPRIGGQNVGIRNMLGEAFKLIVDPRYYDMGQNILEVMQWMKEEGAKLMGLNNLRALTEAAQIPSGDTIEKLQEMAGPLPTDMSRNMEAALKGLGEQFKALFFEFYTVRRRFHLFGPDGITQEDYDYDPLTLVPSNLVLPGLGIGGSRAQRARVHMQNFEFSITPHSVYEMTQSTRRLLLLQLARMGMPISPYTLLEQFDIPNPGRPPEVEPGKPALTEIDKFFAFQKEQGMRMIEMQLELQKRQLELQAQMDPLGQLAGALQGIDPSLAGAMQGGGVKKDGGEAGRPPSGQQPPQQVQKSDGQGGQRTVISESGS